MMLCLILFFSDLIDFNCNIATESIEPVDAHYPPLNIDFAIQSEKLILNYKVWVYDFENCNYVSVNNYLSTATNIMVSIDLSFDDTLELFYNHLYICIELLVPKKKIKMVLVNFLLGIAGNFV